MTKHNQKDPRDTDSKQMWDFAVTDNFWKIFECQDNDLCPSDDFTVRGKNIPVWKEKNKFWPDVYLTGKVSKGPIVKRSTTCW